MTPRLLGVVLCGGKSSRMGRDKSQLRLPDGRTFRQLAVDRLSEVCNDVVISGGEESSEQIVIPDPTSGLGPVVGIAASLKYAADRSFDACLFSPVDTPCLTTSDLSQLKTTWAAQERTTIAFSNRIEPLIGIYDVCDLESIEKLAASELRSLDRFLQSGQIEYSTVSIAVLHCRNINTPEEFEQHAE